MNGAHDMGGMMGFGPVQPEADEPVFHHEWERRVRAMTFTMGRPAGLNIDMGRFAREDRAPLEYLSKSYYEIWFAGLTRLLVERGLVTTAELESGHMATPPKPRGPIVKAADVGPMLAKGRPSQRTSDAPPRFKVGDRVRARNIHPIGHTRLPRYVRGRTGVVTHLHGVHVFPDSNAAELGEAPQWLFTVRFAGTELWGEEADLTVSVSTDAWDSYLEPCQ
jgi:nitrile hydratase subunit beta